jgi:hypothetical protein
MRHGGFLAVLLLLAGPGTAGEFFVAPEGRDTNPGTREQPWATLAGARDALRRLPAAERTREPITVWLREGRYRITRPVTFDARDSGTAAAPITYAAFPGETAVLDGGRRITGWRTRPDGRWETQLENGPFQRWWFRQLYVNGEERPRARIPNQGFLRVAGCPDGTPKTTGYHHLSRGFEFAPGDIRRWHNLNDVEVVVYHFWTDSHLPIQSVDEQRHRVRFVHGASKVFTDGFTEKGARYIVENVLEGLDAPGEWYLDRWTGRLQYLPRPGETPENVEVVAPVARGWLELRGDTSRRRPVEYLRFRNLTFEHVHFQLMNGQPNDRQGASSVPGAITLVGARHCRFEHCRVRRLGTFAFDLKAGCRENAFIANEISQVAAGGFHLDGGTPDRPPLTRTENNVITDNHLFDYGRVYPSAVGILLEDTAGNLVAHNHIHHGYYSAIAAGWVWGYQRSISWGNRIEFNHLHDIGQGLLSDMGAIYTLGVSPGTMLRNNLIHDVAAHQYGGWGIYNDAGSSHLLIESNVVYHTRSAAYNLHYAKEIWVRNNIFALAGRGVISRTRVEPHQSVFFENNIVYWRTGDPFTGRWEDKPYTFFLHPLSSSGRRKMTQTFTADWNLYFNPAQPLAGVRFAGRTWEAWRKAGKDRHSVYADPRFVDADHFDFRLQPDSPAFKLGFHPIDLSRVGPRVSPGPEAR